MIESLISSRLSVSSGLPRGSWLNSALRSATLIHFVDPRRTITGWVEILRRFFSMSSKKLICENLAAAFLSGSWSEKELVRRTNQVFGRRVKGLTPIIRDLCSLYPTPPPQNPSEVLAKWLSENKTFYRLLIKENFIQYPSIHHFFSYTPTMSPIPGIPTTWQLPSITTGNQLAEWLNITRKELDWFADPFGIAAKAKSQAVRHYTYRTIPKSSGNVRLLEIPKSRLKAIQRQILEKILNPITPHESAHGYRRGHSIRTFVNPHCGKRVVFRFDLRHFFPSIRASRIHSLFRSVGYPVEVARLLAGLCTTIVPCDVAQEWKLSWEEERRFRSPHLPQGAPTSPALANLCTYRLDCRLVGLAQSLNANYTRYADDLAFSGEEELERSAKRFRQLVYCIAAEEGFSVHLSKSKVMKQGIRQCLVGLTINRHPNIKRCDYDRLKAILTNCIRQDPLSQNRDHHPDFRAYLLGQIAQLTTIHPAKGKKMRALFEQISWDPPSLHNQESIAFER